MRSPLTRSHLTQVEERARRLEQLISNILPNADIDKLLSKDVRHQTVLRSAPPAQTRQQPPPQQQKELESQLQHRPVLPNDEVPDEADGFDWVEEELKGNELTDGMAALSLNPQGTGYFGQASSSVLLRALHVPPSWDMPLASEEDDATEYQIRAQLLSLTTTPVPKMISDTLIDAFFAYYNSSYPIIHEPTFRAQYEGQLLRPRPDVWELLYNAILALGSWCINHESSSADLIYYHQARSQLSSNILETGNLPLVQALTLLSNYVQKRNKPNTGWNYLGLAIRMALGLGLYREFPNWKSSPLKLEIRRRVWWTLYMFDAGAAVTFGRPINLPGPEIVDAKLPLNVNDNQLTAETEIVPKEIDAPTIYSGIIYQSKFCLITNSIYNRLIAKPSPSAEESLEFNKTIEKFMTELPNYFQPTVYIDTYLQWPVLTKYRLLWRIKNFQIIIFRPFVLQHILLAGDKSTLSEAEVQARRICIQSARETIGLVTEFLTMFQHTSISVWYALYFLFQAALIPIICLSSEPNSEHASEWLSDIQRTNETLLSLTNENQLAARFYDVIDRLTKQYIHTDMSQASINMRNEWMSDIYSLVFDEFSAANGGVNMPPPPPAMPQAMSTAMPVTMQTTMTSNIPPSMSTTMPPPM